MFCSFLTVAPAFAGKYESAAVTKYVLSTQIVGSKNGSITASNSKPSKGSTVTIRVTPKSKFFIESVLVDGIAKSGLPSLKGVPLVFNVENIQRNMLVTVSFSASNMALSGLTPTTKVRAIEPK